VSRRFDNPALRALRHHVTGAIERGEGEAIAEVRAPLDVLAVMDGTAEFMESALAAGPHNENWQHYDAQLRQARAAVAELVEAADAMQTEMHREHPEGLPFRYRALNARLDAALAKFGGA
jgi:hypothetical protein